MKKTLEVDNTVVGGEKKHQQEGGRHRDHERTEQKIWQIEKRSNGINWTLTRRCCPDANYKINAIGIVLMLSKNNCQHDISAVIPCE